MASPSSSSALSTTTQLVFLQIFTRVLTFAMNRTLLRLASAAAYGTASIQFELLTSTILFLSREGVRNALLRAPSSASSATVTPAEKSATATPSAPAVTRPPLLSYLPLAWGTPLALGAAVAYAGYWAGLETRTQPFFYEAVAIYALAALVELAAEPMHNMTMMAMQTNVRVRAEGLAIAGKTLATLLVLLNGERVGGAGDGRPALLAFAAGQMAYALSLLGVYTAHYGVSWLVPNISCVQFLIFILSCTRLAIAMTGQSLVKHVLTECDKLILAWAAPLADQGGYAVAVNYGSLLARIILQPVEETLRLHFSRTQAEKQAFKTKAASAADALTAASVQRTLLNVLSLQLALSLIFVTFAVPYLPVMLPFVLSPKWMATSAPHILQAWMWYVPVLAVNGSLEAYVSSVSSEAALGAWSRYLTLASPVFPAMALSLYRAGFGDAALVYANMASLAARIAYCVRYAFPPASKESKAQQGLTLLDALPGRAVLLACGVASVAIRASSSHLLDNPEHPYLLCVLAHVVFGGCLGVTCVVAWWAGDDMPRRLGLDGWMGLGIIEARIKRLTKARAKEE
ncbi:Rft protein-domain-containing protein [Schizophyllum amplum]|uniref:Man(5)GlcNAc(2)-PP-dolichol translocation protein RFT1 n=1 Tax=Schizophyllum amplum TaxID=97359 RepID=A0A550CPF5_9AGAR|nr:Rft protein-domain-containing protein [Auriculariopsis ampla]